MNYRKLQSFLAACLAGVICLSTAASATVQSASDIVLVPYANSSVENPAAFAVSYSTISSVCSSIVYISPEDKQLFATALAAQTNSIHVNIKYEDNASTVSYGSSSPWSGTTLRCKLLAIWQAKTGY